MKEDIIYANQHKGDAHGKKLFQIVLMIFMLRKVLPLAEVEADEEDIEWWVAETETPKDRDPLVGLYPAFVEIMKVRDQWRQRTNCGGVDEDRTPIKAIEIIVRAVNQGCSRAWDEEIEPLQRTHSIADVLQRIESLLLNVEIDQQLVLKFISSA